MRLKYKIIATIASAMVASAVLMEFTNMSVEKARNYLLTVIWILVVLGFSYLMTIVWDKEKKK